MNIKLFETQAEAEEYAGEVLASQGLLSVMKPRRIVQRVELNKVHVPEWGVGIGNSAWIVIPMGPASRAPFVEKVMVNKEALEDEAISLTNKLDVVEVALDALACAVETGDLDVDMDASEGGRGHRGDGVSSPIVPDSESDGSMIPHAA